MDQLPNDTLMEIFNRSIDSSKNVLTRINKRNYALFKNRIKPLYLLMLEPINEDDYYMFREAVVYVFDLTDDIGFKIIHEISDRDYLWTPDETSIMVSEHYNPIYYRRDFTDDKAYENYRNFHSININYFQWLTMATREREPVREVISYLFYNSDPEYHEPYQFSKEEKEWRRLFYEKLIKKYSTSNDPTGISNYFRRVSKRLWRNENYIHNKFDFDYKIVEARIKKYLNISDTQI